MIRRPPTSTPATSTATYFNALPVMTVPGQTSLPPPPTLNSKKGFNALPVMSVPGRVKHMHPNETLDARPSHGHLFPDPRRVSIPCRYVSPGTDDHYDQGEQAGEGF